MNAVSHSEIFPLQENNAHKITGNGNKSFFYPVRTNQIKSFSDMDQELLVSSIWSVAQRINVEGNKSEVNNRV